ncbi:MAG: ABC transporter permease subunit, partial [Woeseiaceae bacterium]
PLPMTIAADSLAANDARRRLRTLKDLGARYAVTVGGIVVILAIVLIFFYLLQVVLPLFRPASMTAGSTFDLPGASSQTLHLSLDEQSEIAARYTAAGEILFFRTADGVVVERETPAGDDVMVSALGISDLAGDGVILGFDDGRILVTQAEYAVSYPDNIRRVTPGIAYPLGREPIVVDDDGRAVVAVSGRIGEDHARFVSVLADGTVVVTEVGMDLSFLTGETSVTETKSTQLNARIGNDEGPAFALLDPMQEWIYLVAESGDAVVLQRRADRFVLNERLRLVDRAENLTELQFLTGGISLLAGTDRGRVLQWFPVRDAENRYRLHRVRVFEGPDSAVADIAPEHRRKGFIAGHANGALGVYYTTSARTLIESQVSEAQLGEIAISPRGNRIVAATGDGQFRQWQIENEHPEISWSALWGKVWYESYPEPEYVWQSSSASNEFEPKFSLAPLSFGTLKAAFYAMLVAMPLAIMGAIFTAYFMTPALRRMVKPTVEIMEALPTVILGFLAGLWLAPLMEANLAAAFLLIVGLPPAIVLSGFLWTRLPSSIRHLVPAGWEPVLLTLPVLALGWLCFALGGPVENAFFDGNTPQWISSELGIDFSQRNSLVVGIAMGFAVIPVIFSIAEDAVFGVPKHLSYGSLALGATPWQTLVRVVLPTASPGIFSAVMIGFGRAVGETMIVLMATGNTPVMDWNIFEGMRTLSANIAVEMPESEVHSTHYRVLFLAALVLFLFTFLFNTAAEVIRQRLRRKYSAI